MHVPNVYLWRFSGHLDASLQYGDGEAGTGITAEPETEVRVRSLVLQLLLHQLAELWHPAQRQVTVGKKHPVTLDIEVGMVHGRTYMYRSSEAIDDRTSMHKCLQTKKAKKLKS